MKRLTRTNDIEIVKSLHEELFPSDWWYEGDEYTMWKLTVDGNIAGFCTAKDSGYKTLFLSRAGVLNEYAGQGLHRHMIKARVKWGLANGYDKFITYVSLENPRSSNNLIRCGFKVYEPHWKFVGKEFLYFLKE